MVKAESLKWTRTCTRCGKKMVGVASNKKLCDSCLRIRQIEHDRKKAQNNKLEVVERAKPKHAPEDSLQNDVREAERLAAEARAEPARPERAISATTISMPRALLKTIR